MTDPFTELGLSADATLDEAIAARRARAVEVHPDVGGSNEAMQRVNVAFEAVVEVIARRSAEVQPAAPTAPPAPAHSSPRPRFGGGVQRDEPSFTIDRLPVEAFEALSVVASWIGEVLDDDPPYALEVALHEPAPCWCRLDLVPDAGGSTVSLLVAPVEPGAAVPDAEDVRDVWVDLLNSL